jgi:hypothetical protein
MNKVQLQKAGIPSIQGLQKYSVNRPEKEGIRQSLYDFQTYATAGFTSKAFFQVPVGQSSKTYDDTNMQAAGSLPSPQRFLIQSISIYLFSGVLASPANDAAAPFASSQGVNDIAAIAKAGNLTLTVGQKKYLQEAPLGRFPPSSGIVFNSSMAMATTTAATDSYNVTQYARFGGEVYKINPWILLEPTQNFDITLTFATAVATPSGVDARIGVVMDGILYRSAQ